MLKVRQRCLYSAAVTVSVLTATGCDADDDSSDVDDDDSDHADVVDIDSRRPTVRYTGDGQRKLRGVSDSTSQPSDRAGAVWASTILLDVCRPRA